MKKLCKLTVKQAKELCISKLIDCFNDDDLERAQSDADDAIVEFLKETKQLDLAKAYTDVKERCWGDESK